MEAHTYTARSTIQAVLVLPVTVVLLLLLAQFSHGSGITPPAYGTIQNGGTPVTQRNTLNLINGGCVDNAGAFRTDCTLTPGTLTPGFSILDGQSLLLYESFAHSNSANAHQFSETLLVPSSGVLGAEAYPTVDANHPATVEFATGSAGGNDAFLTFGPSAATGIGVGPLNAATGWEFVGTVRLPAITSIGFKFCLIAQSNSQQNGATFPNGACFRFDTSIPDTNWRFITEAASVATNVDTTVAVQANVFYKLRIYSTVSGTWSGDVQPAGGSVTTKTSNTNIPTVLLTPMLSCINRGVAAALFDVSGPLYFDQTGMTRP